MDDGHSMRAVEGSLGHSLKERWRELEEPRSDKSVSRVNGCQAAGGRWVRNPLRVGRVK